MTDESSLPAVEKPAAPRFVGGPDRSETIALECPLEFDGVLYDKITVRRLTGRELDAFVDAARGNPDAVLPVFSCPDEVVQALDASDSMRLNEVAARFFPRAVQTSA